MSVPVGLLLDRQVMPFARQSGRTVQGWRITGGGVQIRFRGKGYWMQVLEAHGKAPRRGRTWLLIAGAVVLVIAAAAMAYGIGKSSNGTVRRTREAAARRRRR